MKLQITASPGIPLCELGWRFERRILEDYDLWYVLSGSGHITIDDRHYDLVPNCCVIMPPGSCVQASQHEKKRLRVFYVHFSMTTDLELPPCTIADNSLLIGNLVNHCNTVYWDKNRAAGKEEAEMILQLIIYEIMQNSKLENMPGTDHLIESLMAQIKIDPGKKWSIDTLAKKANLSRPQFTRRFRNFAGIAPGKFVIQERIQRAIELLKMSGMTISEIADIMGYKDVFYFSKQLKRETGYPPSFFLKS